MADTFTPVFMKWSTDDPAPPMSFPMEIQYTSEFQKLLKYVEEKRLNGSTTAWWHFNDPDAVIKEQPRPATLDQNQKVKHCVELVDIKEFCDRHFSSLNLTRKEKTEFELKSMGYSDFEHAGTDLPTGFFGAGDFRRIRDSLLKTYLDMEKCIDETKKRLDNPNYVPSYPTVVSDFDLKSVLERPRRTQFEYLDMMMFLLMHRKIYKDNIPKELESYVIVTNPREYVGRAKVLAQCYVTLK